MTGPVLTRTLKVGCVGKDVQGVRRACLAFTGQGPPRAPLIVQRTFGDSMTVLVKAAQDQAVIPRTGVVGPQLMEALRRAGMFDAYATQLLNQYAYENKPKPPVPKLGPIVAGGASVLSHSLTHETDGVPGYPAYDDGWVAGKAVLAPERVKITEQSGAAGGDAFFMRGDSTIEYWVGHVAAAPPTGRLFNKGERMATIANIPRYQGGPHVHLGINAKPLTGFELLHRTDYSYGSPTVGAQLKAWSAS